MNNGQRARIVRPNVTITSVILVTLTGLATAVADDTHLALDIAGVTFEFVRIAPGRYLMGSDSGDGDERPVHPVNIDYPFDLGRTEVTRRQFKAFVEATGYETVAERIGSAWHGPSPDKMGWVRKRNWRDPGIEQTDDHPVVCISHMDATAFCRWLSQQSGEHFRLPTEAEWEYAARAGTTGQYAGHLDEMAWFTGTSAQETHPVARKSPNAWGLFDMHGNVAEWCDDMYYWHYGNAPRDGSAHTDPGVPAVTAARRVLRGGSWSSPAHACRSSFRCPVPAAHRSTGTGFRLVRGPRTTRVHKAHRRASTPSPYPPAAPKETPARDLMLNVDEVTFDFVRIDPGTFLMGSPHRYVDRYNWTYEMPIHEVTIARSFYLGATEVTREQFGLFVEETGYVTDAEKQGWAFTCVPNAPWHCQVLVDWRFPGFVQTEREPVTHIGWYDAVAFCQWLSRKTGRCIRLPSEAEWEYACRAGTTAEFAGPLDEMAWTLWNSDRIKHTYPVARKKPNAWGLYDMHGSVWEWVQDVWHADCNEAPTDGAAWVETTDLQPRGITRGGSFASPPWLCRSYIRMRTPIGQMIHYNNGFRVVCELAAPVRSGSEGTDARLVPVKTELPNPQFVGTRHDIRAPRIKPVQTKPYPPFLAPPGTSNVALGKPVSSSDPEPFTGELAMVTDGDKEASEGSFVELGPLLQHITIDLQAEHEIYGIRLWHYHQQPRVYFDVIVQTSNDPNFTTTVTTIFNNDMDDSSGLGLGKGKAMHYVDTRFGELIDAKGARARYVRLYSNGNTTDDLNHYIEVEVYGRPVRDIKD